MILPVEITFRNVERTAAIEKEIQARAQKLETFYNPITSCRVLVEAPARHRQKGYPFHIRIDLKVPQGEIAVTRASALYSRERTARDEHGRKEMETRTELRHLKVAVKEAFDAARRRLQDHARRIRADVKSHEPSSEGRVTKLFPVDGYGFLETSGGREIYFHANSVINDRFKSLKLGEKVSFAEEAGEKGPQASTVRLITKTRATPALTPARTPTSSRKKA